MENNLNVQKLNGYNLNSASPTISTPPEVVPDDGTIPIGYEQFLVDEGVFLVDEGAFLVLK